MLTIVCPICNEVGTVARGGDSVWSELHQAYVHDVHIGIIRDAQGFPYEADRVFERNRNVEHPNGHMGRNVTRADTVVLHPNRKR